MNVLHLEGFNEGNRISELRNEIFLLFYFKMLFIIEADISRGKGYVTIQELKVDITIVMFSLFVFVDFNKMTTNIKLTFWIRLCLEHDVY